MKNNRAPSDRQRLRQIEAALVRAGQRARRIAAQTGTPLVLYENGKIVRKHVSRREALGK